MNAAKGESNVNCAGNAAPHGTNNNFTLNVESQTLPFMLAFDVEQSDGVKDFYTGSPRELSARSNALHLEATEDGAEGNSLSVLCSRWQVPSNDGPYERAVDLQKLRAHCFPERYCFSVSLFEVS